MTNRVPVKGNCADSGSSLEVETLSLLLLRNLKDRLPYAKGKILLHPPSGEPPNTLRLIVSQTPSYTL